MSTKSQIGSVAVVCDVGSAAAAAMQAFLRAEAIEDALWYAPREVDEVDRAVQAGTVGRVIFPRPADLLTPLWNHELALDDWWARGVQVDFVEPPEPAPVALLQTVAHHWSEWRRHHRRRQALAGVLLSAVALAAAFLLNWAAG